MAGCGTGAGRWKDRLARSVGPAALRVVYHLVSATYRYRLVHGQRLAGLLQSPRPVVLCFWHDQVFTAARFLYRRLHRSGLELTLVASRSRDGELVTRFARPWKLRVVRGSSSHGGREAMLGIYRSVVRHDASPVLIPDGPRGPAHRFKPGAVLLSRFSGAPILPLAFVPQRSWTLGSWDRMAVPAPGSRIAVVIGELHQVPRELDTDGLAREREAMESILEALVDEGRAVFGDAGTEERRCRARVETVEETNERG